MTFKKIFIKTLTNGNYTHNVNNKYTISTELKSGYGIYFTDERGLEQIKGLYDKEITFAQLPKPLLQEIK